MTTRRALTSLAAELRDYINAWNGKAVRCPHHCGWTGPPENYLGHHQDEHWVEDQTRRTR